MDNTMRVLIVEDLSTDALLIKREVKKVLSQCEFFCVETKKDFLEALNDFKPDIILSDFRLPSFDGLTALKLAKDNALEVPIIIVTGSMDEDTAVDCMKAGAWDYVIKEHLKRLGPAILSSLELKELRVERKKAEEERESLLQLNQAMFNDHDAAMLIIDPISGEFLDVNPAATKFYGYTKEEFLELDIGDINVLEEEEIQQRMMWVLENKQKRYTFHHKLKNGEIRLVDVYSCPIVHQGVNKLYSIVFDVTDREKFKEELFQEKEYLNSLIQYANAPIITWTPDFKISEFNRAAEKLTGRKWIDVMGQHIGNLFPEKNREDIMKSIEKVKEGECWQNEEIPILNLSGENKLVLWNSSNIKNANGEYVATIAQGTDITKRKEAEEKFMYLSYHDYVTEVYNRRFFEEELRRLDTKRNYPLTIIMGDVNGLKLINDSFGHETGDQLLKKAAEVMKAGCRSDDIIARTGGDEFAIILPNTQEQEAEEIIKRIKEQAFKVKLNNVQLSISFGYATKYNNSVKRQEILAAAENYMYKRKMYESASMRNKTIDVIMNALFEKSEREMLHSKRVSAISGAIAMQFGFSEDEINKIKMSGLLHDIGKIGIDEKILNKEGKLDEQEWIEIKKHPEAGWRILSSVDEFSDLAKHVLYHHESWNGKGYPEGLKGEEIPIESRIISLADAFDAMTKDRTYRKAMSNEEAICELKRNKGTQFDPNIVDIFVSMLNKNGANFYKEPC
ncbi:UNVERIFIED_CONTAM: PAS domain S-box-containing protein/diguanylate cyclase (GGDEF)-like protein [Acetivibrio alkalicellulosi]